MWELTVPLLELVGRAALTYLFLLALLRITGKRQVGQLAPFDLILLLILSNAVQNAMNGGDNSFTAGVVSAATLVALNGLVGWATYRSKWLEGLIEGRPRVLIHNGRLLEGVLRAERMTRHELMAALRRAGCDAIEQVHTAVLENNGQISVTPLRFSQTTAGREAEKSGEAEGSGPPRELPDGDPHTTPKSRE
jgi:uncharacterized membrane protein YcaP (DUF421 family)